MKKTKTPALAGETPAFAGEPSFTEQPCWLHPSLHISQALYLSVCLDLTDMSSASAVAAKNCITSEMVTAVMDLIQFEPPKKLPAVLCMDEFKGDSGNWDPSGKRWHTEKYHASLVDGSSHAVIDVLPKIRSSELMKYFRQFPTDERKDVRFFCCDMHNGFIRTAREMFPNCIICIDMFHVIKHLNEDMVDAIRRRLQNSENITKEEYSLLKGSMLILKTKEKNLPAKYLSSQARVLARLARTLDTFPELWEAYEALQTFHRIQDESAYSVQRVMLTEWLDTYRGSDVPEIVKAANMIRHWRGYIQNTWKYGQSNGVCEGFNNSIKVLKRISYGLHNFETLRRRILLTCGYAHLSHSPKALFAKNTTKKGGSIL